jgi:hypothetical protein
VLRLAAMIDPGENAHALVGDGFLDPVDRGVD